MYRYTLGKITRWQVTHGKHSPANAGNARDAFSIPGHEDPLEKEMETH